MNPRTAVDRARRHLERRIELNQRPLHSGDTAGVRQIVVIPVLAEGRWLFRTLASLALNDQAERSRTLVICVVNNRPAPPAKPEHVADNQLALRQLEALARGMPATTAPEVDPAALRLGFVDASSPGHEIGNTMGVGEARRIGLDLAVSVLVENAEPHGTLLSLDADTLVEPDYLTRVREHFEACDERSAVVSYAHPLPDEPVQRRAIVLYELFLRYHELGLRFAGSPYAFPTIGSTIIARADAYVAAGGMNRRQAGEDFYFLQQLAKTGGVGRIDTTTVRPDARPSDRVPFGTGASLSRYLSGRRDADTVYHPDVYSTIGRWLHVVRTGLDQSAQELLQQAGDIDRNLRDFLVANRFEETWPRLRNNAPDREGLEAQFHRWFDAFRTLKLIHFLRDHTLPEVPIFAACREILAQSGLEVSAIDWTRIDDDDQIQIALLDLMRRACAG